MSKHYSNGTPQISAASISRADIAPTCDACAFSGPARGWTGVGPDELECRHQVAALPGDVVFHSVGNWLCVAMRSQDGACGPDGRLFRQTEAAPHLGFQEFAQDSKGPGSGGHEHMFLGFSPQGVVADRISKLMPRPGQPVDESPCSWSFPVALNSSRNESCLLQQLHMRREFERVNALQGSEDRGLSALPDGQFLHGQHDAPNQIHVSFHRWLLGYVKGIALDKLPQSIKVSPPILHFSTDVTDMKTSSPGTYSNGTRKFIDSPLLVTGTDACADLQPGYFAHQLGFLDSPRAIPGGSVIRIDPFGSFTTPATAQRAVLRS